MKKMFTVAGVALAVSLMLSACWLQRQVKLPARVFKVSLALARNLFGQLILWSNQGSARWQIIDS